MRMSVDDQGKASCTMCGSSGKCSCFDDEVHEGTCPHNHTFLMDYGRHEECIACHCYRVRSYEGPERGWQTTSVWSPPKATPVPVRPVE